MIAEVSGADLYLFIRTDKEIYGLVPQNMRHPATRGCENYPIEKCTLSSKLTSRKRNDLTAIVTLGFVDKTRSKDGVDVLFSPQDELDWSRIKNIDVLVAYSLYNELSISGLIVAPYFGDNRIRIKFGC